MNKTTFLLLLPLLLPGLLPAHPPGAAGPVSHTSVAYTSARPPRPVAAAPTEAAKLVAYALSLKGSPYVYAGIKPDGFDCSGFVTHVFSRFGFDVPHSSALQAKTGSAVQREDARPGDLIIFTGTKPSVRAPGHAGIVISQPGEIISFVHASSNGGVKISQVEGSRYNLRFLQVRRVLAP